MRGRSPLPNVPWITKDGTLDLAKFPIEGLLQQTLDRDPERWRSGVRLLSSMHSAGRAEAGVFLVGLFMCAPDEWETRSEIVEALAVVKTAGCARVLLDELKRVKSSNATRRYLSKILDALSRMPLSLTRDGLVELLGDDRFTYKMKAKFSEVLEVASEEE
jgi:hypothetical protein